MYVIEMKNGIGIRENIVEKKGTDRQTERQTGRKTNKHYNGKSEKENRKVKREEESVHYQKRRS